jgi:hypothetical protein
LFVLELRKNIKNKAVDLLNRPTAQENRAEPTVTKRPSLASAIFEIMSRPLFFIMEPAMGIEPATY